jgi:hypothetical protein
MNTEEIKFRIAGASSLEPLKVPTFLVLDAVQHAPPHVQLQGIALALAGLCRPLEIDPHDLVSRANRQLNEAAATRQPIFEALSDYAVGELK